MEDTINVGQLFLKILKGRTDRVNYLGGKRRERKRTLWPEKKRQRTVL